ncbi:MAG: von Willebrand factor type [Myxococcales bacterium]|nr:von Willebrand factor type [Myxococcales bacterium]
MEFDEQFLKKLEYLYVVAKKVFVGRMRAERRSRKTGSGVEFADHRNYTAGDDLRYLDWSAYGRLDKLLLRMFEEEEDLHIYLLVDASASMRANGKLDYAERICAALAYIGLAKLDRVSIVPFGGGGANERLPASRGKAQIFKVFQFLTALEATGKTELSHALESFVHQHKRRGLAIVVSDFYDPDGYEDGLNLLRYHRFEPTVLQIWSQAEARPTLRGDLEIVDVESGVSREVTVTERQLSAYARAHADYCARLEAFCGARGISYYRADVAVPFEELVLRMFREGGFLS